MKNRLFSIVLIILMLHLSQVNAQLIKFHPIGDSTTEAYELESSWRYWLFKKLLANGFDNIDFVGSRTGTNMGTNFSDNNWDMNHDGHTSSTASQVLNGGLAHGHSGNINIWAPQYTPHIAVIYLGTNDIRQGRSSSDIITTFEDIIQVLRNARAEVKIVVCQIPDWSYSGYGGSQAGVDGLNTLIPSLENLGTNISPIKIVDLNTDYSVSDHRDGIHPGPTGAPKIADRIYDAITPWLNENSDPSIEITSPLANALFQESSNITIDVEASSNEGNITTVEFLNGNSMLGQVTSPPYQYHWQEVQAGNYTITAIATNNIGNSSQTSINIRVLAPQEPYSGISQSIPGKIEFEEFDEGGNENAYYDDSPGTSVPDAPNYRPDEDVDIETCSDTDGGYNIGYGKAGEWLEYTVNVATTGMYDLVIRAACDGDGRTVSLSYEDGTSIASDIAIPNTGGWQTWEDVTVNDIELEAGEQVIRLTIGDADYVNLNYMSFSTDTPPVIPPSIFITSPSDNDEFNSDQTISITADASATDATIVDVKFYAGTQLLFTDDSAPYSYEWSGMSAGTYQILAIATDSNNSEAEDEISVTVIDAPAPISLQAGWNLIGYPYIESADIASALSSIWNNVEIVKNDEAYYNTSQADFLNLLQTLEWGKGYLIKVSEDCELNW